MPGPDVASNREVLHKRVTRLLQLDSGALGTATELRVRVLPFLSSLGSAALIGGAIRDVARGGRRAFSSDLDFVIHGSDSREFAERVSRVGAVRNRFGGYSLNNFQVKIDVWHIEDTWAKTAGLVNVRTVSDLLSCTFFDWDSVLFDIVSRRLLIPEDYFDKLACRVMDIRLEENPNPEGSLVRALRRAMLWNVRFGPRLTAFARHWLDVFVWNDLVALDARAFPQNPLLARLQRSHLVERLSVGSTTLPVPKRERQSQLGLPLVAHCSPLGESPAYGSEESVASATSATACRRRAFDLHLSLPALPLPDASLRQCRSGGRDQQSETQRQPSVPPLPLLPS